MKLRWLSSLPTCWVPSSVQESLGSRLPLDWSLCPERKWLQSKVGHMHPPQVPWPAPEVVLGTCRCDMQLYGFRAAQACAVQASCLKLTQTLPTWAPCRACSSWGTRSRQRHNLRVLLAQRTEFAVTGRRSVQHTKQACFPGA